MPWWLWVLVGVVVLAGEAVSMALFLLNVAVAAFVVAVLAALHVSPAVQVGGFVLLAVVLIALVRPRLLRALVGRGPQRTLTTQEALVGRLATVTEAVTDDVGTVRVGRAEFWTARAASPAQQIEAGSRVRIARVEGLTAYVEPIATAPLESGVSGPDEMVGGPEQGVPVVPPPSFGELLKAHRVASNLTQEALAERARLSVRAISDLERGLHRTPQKDTARLLADALHLSAQDRAAFEAAARRLGDASAPRLRA